jgi:F0F1-type ATP synthase membrane subunit a
MQFFLIIFEIISFIIRVFSLAIQLATNIISGHILMLTISNFLVNYTKIKNFCSFYNNYFKKNNKRYKKKLNKYEKIFKK